MTVSCILRKRLLPVRAIALLLPVKRTIDLLLPHDTAAAAATAVATAAARHHLLLLLLVLHKLVLHIGVRRCVHEIT